MWICACLLLLFTCAYCLLLVVLFPSPVGGFICQVLVLLGHCSLHLVYHTIATPQPQNMLLPLSPWHKNLTKMSQFWWHFWPTHAHCHAFVDRARPALSTNAWQLARVYSGQSHQAQLACLVLPSFCYLLFWQVTQQITNMENAYEYTRSNKENMYEYTRSNN